MIGIARRLIAGPAAPWALGVVGVVIAVLVAVIVAQRVQVAVLAGQVEGLTKEKGEAQVAAARQAASIAELRGQVEAQNEATRKIAADCRAASADAAARGVAAYTNARRRQQAANVGTGPEEMNRWLSGSP